MARSSTSPPPRRAAKAFPDHRRAALTALWRDKQFQYTWLRSLQGRYADFWQVTGDALDFALDSLDLAAPDLRDRLMDLYLGLEPFPEVPAVLRSLRQAGFRTAILSNGSPKMLDARRGARLEACSTPFCRPTRSASTRPIGGSINTRSISSALPAQRDRLPIFQRLGRPRRIGLRHARCVVQSHGQRRERLPGAPDFEIKTLAELPGLLAGGS